MIPDIEQILIGLKDGAYTLEQANSWFLQHIEMAVGAIDKQLERRELFKQVARDLMVRPSGLRQALLMEIDFKEAGKLTNDILNAAEAFSKEPSK